MGKKLFVGGISWNTSEDSLRQAFENYGAVEEATIVTDRDTGRSRGFGFVTFAEDGGAQSALESMNGAELDGRRITVNEAHDKRGGGGGGGGRDRDRGDDMRRW